MVIINHGQIALKLSLTLIFGITVLISLQRNFFKRERLNPEFAARLVMAVIQAGLDGVLLSMLLALLRGDLTFEVFLFCIFLGIVFLTPYTYRRLKSW